MYRNAMKQLEAWKTSRRRKPLLVQGARQVGKTWLIREFGKNNFDKVAYVSFYDNEDLARIFDGSLEADRLVDALSIASGVTIGDADTLVVMDEIQACPRAIMSLKAFNEQRPDLAVIGAGSLLGIALHRDARSTSFPVGKVSWLNLYPMTFDEFLRAMGQGQLADALRAGNVDLISSFQERLTDHLRRYYFVGGMPEAVDEYAQTGDYGATRSIQLELLDDYERDFSKYASPSESEKIRLVWNSIPSQLARENKKFMYTAVRPSGRARDFETAIQWLVDAGMVMRVPRISKPGIPLSAYEDFGVFKLYALDVGLLGARSGLGASTLIAGDALFTEFKGALTEQYVCQQLIACGLVPWYWSASNSSGEVDFVLQMDSAVIPVEVKAEENLRARSLQSFCSKYGLARAVRLSMSPYRRENTCLGGGATLENVPLYAAGQLREVLGA
jgi:predicted AAA+ superfamily ATPase